MLPSTRNPDDPSAKVSLMSDTDVSARLQLPFILPSQAQKHVTYNSAIERLDALVQLVLEEIGLNTPPATPSEGQVWVVGSAPTDAWTGHEGRLAQWIEPGWAFFDPFEGWRAWDKADQQLKTFDGSSWIGAGGTQNLPGVGINASWDTTNRLSVSADASLLNHDGVGHQLKINKAQNSDTASLLFQSEFIGHAEMGLAGTSDFSIKVTSDGANWVDALRIDGANGTVSGAAVQSDASDLTSGRLARVGAFGMSVNMLQLSSSDNLNDLVQTGYYYNASGGNTAGNNYPVSSAGYLHVMRQNNNRVVQIFYEHMDANPSLFPNAWLRGKGGSGWSDWSLQYNQHNVVGSVNENAGRPTGAMIESASTPDGFFTKFADGTMICTATRPAQAASDAIWNFPENFAVNPVVSGVGQGADEIFALGNGGVSPFQARFRLWQMSATPSRISGDVDLMAVGRWY